MQTLSFYRRNKADTEKLKESRSDKFNKIKRFEVFKDSAEVLIMFEFSEVNHLKLEKNLSSGQIIIYYN